VAHGAVAIIPTDEKPYSVQIGFFDWKATAEIKNALAKLDKQQNDAKT
jgi:hypothetical protein